MGNKQSKKTKIISTNKNDQEQKHNEKKETPLFDHANEDQRELIIFGFIRNIQNEFNTNQLFPNEIIEICKNYCSKVYIYFCKNKITSNIIEPTFIDKNENKSKMIQILNCEESQLHVSSTALTLNMKGTYEWTVKIIEKHNNDNIGIIEKIKYDGYNGLFYQELYFGDTYFWWNHSGNIWRRGSSNYFKIDKTVWKPNDTVTVRVNCDEWTIEWLYNNISLGGPFKLDKNTKSFYPAIAFGGSSSIYHNLLY